MRILFTIPKGVGSTSMPFVERLFNSLVDCGQEVEKIYLTTSFNPKFFIPQAIKIWRISKDYDLIHAQYGTYTGLITSLFSRSRVIITFRGSDLNYVRNEKKIKWLAQMMASHIAAIFSDGCICVSQRLREIIFYKKESIVIPSSIDLTVFKPTQMADAKKELGLKNEINYVLFCEGNNPQLKGITLALEIRNLISKQTKSTELLILPNIDATILSKYFSACSCLIFLSHSEGSPNLIKEALACNMPILSVDVGDVKALISGTSISKIVKRDSYEIYSQIKKVIQDGRRENVREKMFKYDGLNISQVVLDFYRKILEKK